MTFRELLNEGNSKDIFKVYMLEMLPQFLQSKDIDAEKLEKMVQDRENVVALQNTLIQMVGDLKLDKPKFRPTRYNVELITNGDKNTYDSEWFKMKDAERFTISRKALAFYLETLKIEVPKENWVK